MIIDRKKGLGRYLIRSGVLDNRVLLPKKAELILEPGFTYRRYYYDQGPNRFAFDLEFSSSDFDETSGSLTWKIVGSTKAIYHRDLKLFTREQLGIYHDKGDLNVLLSKKRIQNVTI